MSHHFHKQDQKHQGQCPQCVQVSGEHAGETRLVLTQISNGCRCRVRQHMAQGAIRQRLLDLGFVPNAEVEMVRCATLGDPLELRLGDYFVTLRKREADLIEVHDG